MPVLVHSKLPKIVANDKMSLEDKFANDYRHKNLANELCSSIIKVSMKAWKCLVLQRSPIK